WPPDHASRATDAARYRRSQLVKNVRPAPQRRPTRGRKSGATARPVQPDMRRTVGRSWLTRTRVRAVRHGAVIPSYANTACYMECARLAWVLPFAWRGANSYGPDRSNGNGGSDVFDAVIDKAWCASSAGRARYDDAARRSVPGAVELRRHRLIQGRPLAEAGASDVT